jgi:site-specific DNA recombinase
MDLLLPLVVIYYRCSSSKQDTSIAHQREAVELWIQGRYTVVEIYIDEGKSGSKDTRKRVQFLRMIADLTRGKYKGKVKTVVCLNFDRFGRLDSLAAAEHKRELRDAGVKLDTPMDGPLDWSKSIDRIVDSVKSEAAHAVAVSIGEKGLQGRITATKKGRPNQKTPYGMAKEVVSPTGQRTIIARGQVWATPKTWTSKFVPGLDQQAQAVRDMFRMWVEEDISFNEIARRLAQKGYPAPGSVGWQGQFVRDMLRNCVYVGDLAIGRVGRGQFFQVGVDGKATEATGRKCRGEPIVTRDAHEGLVRREVWDQAQDKIARTTKKRKPPRGGGPYALTGIIHCGVCGFPMYGTKGQSDQSPQRRKTIYRCHRVEETAGSNCGYWIAYEEQLLPYLTEKFLPELMEEIKRRDLQTAREVLHGQEEERSALVQQLASLDTKLQTARRRFLEATDDLAGGLKDTLQGMERERREVADRLKAMQQDTPEDRVHQWLRRLIGELMNGSRIELPGTEPYTTSEEGVALCNYPATLPVSVLREKLKSLGVRMDVWFKRREKGQGRGWTLHKVRVQAQLNPAVCYEWEAKATS